MFRFFLLSGIIVLTLICVSQQLPWYLPAGGSALLAFVLPVWRRGGSWFAFLGGFFSWGVYAGIINWENQGILSNRLAAAFGLLDGWLLVLLTALVGGITTGLGGWFGAALRLTFREKQKKGTSTYPGEP